MVQTGTPRSLMDWTDDELESGLRAKAKTTLFAYNDIAQEIDRRTRSRQEAAALRAADVLTWATVAYAIITAILVLVTWLN
jgi:hypothetical protein